MEWMILPLKRYFDFRGRSRRKEYWMYTLFLFLVSIALSVLDDVLGLGGTVSGGTDYSAALASVSAAASGGWLTNIFTLATFIPSLAVGVRRLHDLDRSGWWMLMPLIPFLVGGVLLGVGLAQSFGGSAPGGLILPAIALLIVGFICSIVVLVWFVTPGTAGPNRFGEDPTDATGGVNAEDVFG